MLTRRRLLTLIIGAVLSMTFLTAQLYLSTLSGISSVLGTVSRIQHRSLIEQILAVQSAVAFIIL